MSLWLTAARTEAADETVAAGLAAVLALTSAVDDRFAAAGIAGMSGARDLHRRLATVLAAVDLERVTALRYTIAAVEHELRHATRVLTRLRELKEALDVPDAEVPRRPDRAT